VLPVLGSPQLRPFVVSFFEQPYPATAAQPANFTWNAGLASSCGATVGRTSVEDPDPPLVFPG
jgi:hypothetical protein